MKTKKPDENEIDCRVIEQADDDSAWEKPVRVKRVKTLVTLPANLAARAAFLARLHRKASIDEWLTNVIQERVELEEAAFADARQAMSSNEKSIAHFKEMEDKHA